MGWLPGWAKRIKLTLDHNDIGAAQSYFQVLVYLSSSSGRTPTDMTAVFDEVGANRKKIAVTKSDGTTQLYVEIERWDSGNEKAWLWVSRSGWSISNTVDEVAYLYYDNFQPDNTTFVGDIDSTPGHNVWSPEFKSTWHMPDDTTSTIKDSTSNGIDGTKGAANQPLEADGKIGRCQDFSGGNYYIDVDDATDKTVWTLIAWLKLAGTSGIQTWYSVDGTNEARFFTQDSPLSYCYYNSGNFASEYALDTDWHHIVFAFDGTNVRTYFDGVLDETNVAGEALTGNSASIGRRVLDNSRFWGYLIDEVRLTNDTKDLNWSKAAYESERDDLIAFGSEELAPVVGRHVPHMGRSLRASAGTGDSGRRSRTRFYRTLEM